MALVKAPDSESPPIPAKPPRGPVVDHRQGSDPYQAQPRAAEPPSQPETQALLYTPALGYTSALECGPDLVTHL